MTEPIKPHGGRREGAGRKRKPGDPLTEQGIFLRLTQRQLDYLGCAAILNLDAQDLVRMALDNWINEQAGEPGI